MAPSLLQAEAPGLLRAELVSCPLREDLFEDQGTVKLLLRSSDQRAPRKGTWVCFARPLGELKDH